MSGNFGSGDLGMGVSFSLYNKASAPAEQIKQSMLSLEKTVSRVSNTISSSAQNIVSGAVAVAATAALMIGPFVKGIQMANKFEQALSAAFARGGADNLAQLDLLRQEALKISEETTFGAQEVADTYIVLAQAGFKNLQILNQIRPVTLLAAAGDISLAKAAEYAGNAMHQFNLTSEDFGHIADVMVGGANESAQSLENLNQALKYLGPTAKSLNMSMEETVAYTELVANAGMKGSIGARAFGSSLLNLTGASSKAAKAMAEIGIDPFAGPGRTFVGLSNLVKQLSRAFHGLTQEQRLKSIAQIFGKDASQEISTLLLENIQIVKNGEKVYMSAGDALEYFTKKNFESAGLAQRTMDIMKDNAQGWTDRVKSMFKTLMINVGETFQESIKSIGPWLMKVLSGINKIIKSPLGAWLLKTTMIIGMMTTALVAFSFVVVTLIPSIWGLVTAAGALLIEFAPIIAVLVAIGYAIYKVVQGMESFDNASLNAAGNFEKPLTAWEKMAGVMAGLGEIWKTWDGTTFKISADLHDKLAEAGVLDETLAMGTYLVRAQEFSKGFIDTFKLAEWTAVGDALMAVGDAIKNILLQLGLGPASGTIQWWKQFGKDLGTIFSTYLVNTLKATAFVFENLFNGLSLLIATLVEFKRNGIYNFDTKEWFSWDRVMDNAFNGGKPSKNSAKGKVTPQEEAAKKMVLNNGYSPKSIGDYISEANGALWGGFDKSGGGGSKTTQVDVNADVYMDSEKIGKILKKKSQTEFERLQGH